MNENLENVENLNPHIYNINKKKDFNRIYIEKDITQSDEIDKYEVYDVIKNINDPEHPLTLEQLNVVNINLVEVEVNKNHDNVIKVMFTPTIPNCSMSTLIGLLIKIKLLLSFPNTYKIDVSIEPGKHYQEESINKQLNDKERVCAAFENDNIKKLVRKGIENGLDYEEFIEAYM